MKPSEIKISPSVESYYEKTAEYYLHCYTAEKCIVSKLSKIAQIEDFNAESVKISRSYLS